jgi:hypothetical protein
MKNKRKHNHTKLLTITNREIEMIQDEWNRRYNAEVSSWISNQY